MLRSGVDSGESFWKLCRERRWTEAAEVLGAAPWLWVITAVCPVAAGALASFYPEQIKAGFYPFFWRHTSFDWVPTAFWSAVALAGLSFGLAQWSQSRAGGALRSMVRRLQTLPPSGFLDSFRDAFRVAGRQTLLVALNPTSSLSQVDHAIRNVLGAIVEVARDFDEQNSATYGANLMLWRRAGTPFENPSPMHLVPYSPQDPSVRGYLELVVSLSTTTALENSQYSHDTQIAPIVVPVAIASEKVLDAKGHARDPVLPGAPQAFLRGDFVVFESVEAYVGWLDENSSRGLETVNPLKEYFVNGAGKHVKSFGSRPIVSVNPTVGPIAVLNIHSDRDNLLQDSGQTLFAPLIEPFCFLLATLIETRAVLLSTGEAVTAQPESDRKGEHHA
jgi:hypothetical protein